MNAAPVRAASGAAEAAASAAAAAADAAVLLAGACSRPGRPLASCAAVLKTVLEAVRELSGALTAEARLTALALAPAAQHAGGPEPSADHAVRRRLERAALAASGAGEDIYRAWRAVLALAGDGAQADDDGTLRAARAAARRAGELTAALQAAGRDPGPGPDQGLALVAAHRRIAEALAVTARQLARACDSLRENIRSACAATGPGARRDAGNATGALFRAVMHLKDARARAAAAEAELADTWTRRKALPGAA